MFLDGLKSILEREDDIEIVAEALNGEEAIKVADRMTLDIILMDVTMPRLNGFTTTAKIKEKYPNIKVLLLTMHGSRDFIEQALEIEADGYVLKNTGKDELTHAIFSLGNGEKYYSEEVKRSFMDSFGKKSAPQAAINLSKREIEVLRLVVQELSTTQIADKLFISHHTVDTHRKNLLSKLGVKNTAGLVKYAMQNGLS